MKMAGLSFEQTPPISVPYRFFLAAPVFGIVAGLLAAALGAQAFSSRWAPGALAMTHALAAGYVLQALCGATLQIVPVAAGGNVWQPRRLAAFLQPLLVVGAAALLSGFAFSRPEWFWWAGLLLGAAVALFVAVTSVALLRAQARGMTIVALRLSLFGLAVAAILGVAMAGALAAGRRLPVPDFADVHAAWGLAGWALMLVVGVSYLVVPMFQLTPPYPEHTARIVPWGLFAVCVLWSAKLLDTGTDGQWWTSAIAAAGLLVLAWYGGSTLRLLQRRRRKLPDVTLLFWRTGMASLLAIPLSWLVVGTIPTLGEHPRMPLWFGVLIFVGVLTSLINGMLYKIVPFLGWLHLQRSAGVRHPAPNMKLMIPERAMRRQMRVHLAALALLLAAAWEPALVRVGGLVFALSCAWLEWNLVGGMLSYRRTCARNLAAEAADIP